MRRSAERNRRNRALQIGGFAGRGKYPSRGAARRPAPANGYSEGVGTDWLKHVFGHLAGPLAQFFELREGLPFSGGPAMEREKTVLRVAARYDAAAGLRPDTD